MLVPQHAAQRLPCPMVLLFVTASVGEAQHQVRSWYGNPSPYNVLIRPRGGCRGPRASAGALVQRLMGGDLLVSLF